MKCKKEFLEKKDVYSTVIQGKERYYCHTCRAEFQQNYAKSARGRENYRKSAMRYYHRNRLKARARARLRYAVKVGKVEKPAACEFGCVVVPEAHHPDYRRPFEVRWLCKRHHEETHTKR